MTSAGKRSASLAQVRRASAAGSVRVGEARAIVEGCRSLLIHTTRRQGKADARHAALHRVNMRAKARLCAGATP
jgi:hypothetical protein